MISKSMRKRINIMKGLPMDYDKERLEQVRKFLEEELDDKMEMTEIDIPVSPILHNDDVIILQFNGWSINLYSDGTWIWEDTSGG